MNKTVQHVDEYDYKGTEYVVIGTSDNWLYRFMRPSKHEPYRYELRQRPDSERDVDQHRTPAPVVEHMEENYDSAQLHPECTRSGDR